MEAFGGLGAGKRCAAHPDRPAVVTCSRCGDYACASCYDVSRQGEDLCTTCMAAMVQHTASRSDRLLATMINTGIVLGMCVPVVALVDVFGPDGTAAVFAFAGLMLLVWVAANIYLLATRGQSVGKLLMKIRIVADDGTPAGIFTILVLRLFIPQVLSSLCSIFGLMDALAIFREDSRCIHDHIANTIVVKVNETGPTAF